MDACKERCHKFPVHDFREVLLNVKRYSYVNESTWKYSDRLRQETDAIMGIRSLPK